MTKLVLGAAASLPSEAMCSPPLRSKDGGCWFRSGSTITDRIMGSCFSFCVGVYSGCCCGDLCRNFSPSFSFSVTVTVIMDWDVLVV